MKKISIAASALFALTLCCGFALKNPQAAPQELTVEKSKLSYAPISIIGATSIATGITVTVRNDAAVPVTYFELHMGDCRVWAGQGAFDRQTLNHPKYAQQTALSLASGETRAFDFPIKTKGATIRIYLVFLSNGQGYWKDRWLRKRDMARPDGLLWDIDNQETEKHAVKQSAKREYPRNVGKSFALQNCLESRGIEFIDCAGPSGECHLWVGHYELAVTGINVYWLDTGCYIPLDPYPCGFVPSDYYAGGCF